MSELINSFFAFNVNAGCYLIYALKSNLWLILIGAAAAASIILSLREEIESTVTEEQRIL